MPIVMMSPTTSRERGLPRGPPKDAEQHENGQNRKRRNDE